MKTIWNGSRRDLAAVWRACSQLAGLPVEALQQKRRGMARWRAVAMTVFRRRGMSSTTIAAGFHVDHTTVLSGACAVARDPELQALVEEVEMIAALPASRRAALDRPFSSLMATKRSRSPHASPSAFVSVSESETQPTPQTSLERYLERIANALESIDNRQRARLGSWS